MLMKIYLILLQQEWWKFSLIDIENEKELALRGIKNRYMIKKVWKHPEIYVETIKKFASSIASGDIFTF